MTPQMHYCYGEFQNVPENELLHRKNGMLFKPEIHDVESPHFLNGMTLIGGRGTPGTVTAVTLQFDQPAHAVSFDPRGNSISVDNRPGEGVATDASERSILTLHLYELVEGMVDDDLRELIAYAEGMVNG